MSTKATTIKVMGKNYPFRFGMKFQRIFMGYYGINKIADYQKKIELVSKTDQLDGLTALGNFIKAAIEAGSKKPVNLDVDDIIDDLVAGGEDQQNEILNTLSAQFQAGQPSEEESPSNALGKSNE